MLRAAMESPALVIAKASFAAVLLNPDPPPCSRADIEQFHALLGAAIARCSPGNVQKCKQWALRNLVQSRARVAALARYLTALAHSFAAGHKKRSAGHKKRSAGHKKRSAGHKKRSAGLPQAKQARGPSVKRKRLHILYILNDILYHTTFRNRSDTFAAQVKPALPDLVGSAAAFPAAPKHSSKIVELVDIWARKNYFSADFISGLRSTILRAAVPAPGADGNGTQGPRAGKTKEAPFVLPAQHGDSSTPWYDLPAGNWLPVLEPNSTRPLNPSMIRPLKLAPGPADAALVGAVKRVLADVDRIYAKDVRLDSDPSVTIDQMGQRVQVNETSGDARSVDSYYGWSRAFCEKINAGRNKRTLGHERERGRNLSRSRSHSRSPSSRSSGRPRSHSAGSFPPPAFKRRRPSPSPSQSRSVSRRRDYSRDRDRERAGWDRDRGRDRSGDRSRDRHRDRAGRDRDEYRRRESRGHSKSPRSRSRSRSRDAYRGRSPLNQDRRRRGDSYGSRRSQSPPRHSPTAARTSPLPNNATTGVGGLPNKPQLPPPPQIPSALLPLLPLLQAGFPAFQPPPPPLPPHGPPTNFMAPWPPLPPSMPHGWVGPPMPPLPPGGNGWQGGWMNHPAPPPPPPPGPPPHSHMGYQQQQPHYGRGGNQAYRGYGNRGGYGDRGRGW